MAIRPLVILPDALLRKASEPVTVAAAVTTPLSIPEPDTKTATKSTAAKKKPGVKPKAKAAGA